MFRQLFRLGRKTRTCQRTRLTGSPFGPWQLRLESLESRLAPACTLTGQTVSCDAGNDAVEIRIGGSIQVFNNSVLLGTVSSGTVTVNGGGGTNSLFVNDSAFTGSNTYTLTTSPSPRINVGTGPFLSAVYTGINSFLRLDTASGSASSHDTVNVNSTAAGPTITVNSGSGIDNIDVTFPTGNLESLGGALTVNGGGGTDSLIFYDDLNTFSDTYTLTSTSLARSFAPTTTFGTVETLTVFAGTGDNPIDVDSTPAGSTTTVNAGSGYDHIVVTFPSGNLESLGGPLTINGQADGDGVTFYDDFNGFADTYTLTSTSLARSFAPTTTFTVEGLTVNAGSGANPIYIDSTPGHSSVNAGSGNDDIHVTNASGDIQSLGGQLQVNGQGDTDGLTLWDDLSGFSGSYTLYSTHLVHLSAPTTGFGTIEALTINAATGANSISIYGTPAGSTTTVNAGNGNDNIHVTNNSTNLESLGGALTVNGQGDTDSVTFYDNLNSFADIYILTSTSLARSLAPTTTFGTVETLTVHAGSGANPIYINSTPSGSTTTVNAGAGNDNIHVTDPSGNLESLGGALTVNGQADSDSVIFWDDFNPFSDTYTLTATTLARSFAPTTTFGTVEALTVVAGTGNNPININSPVAGVALTVNAGPGNDTINVAKDNGKLAALSLDVFGGTGTNKLNLYDHKNTNPSPTYTVTSSGSGDGSVDVSAPAFDSDFQDISVVMLYVKLPSVVNKSGYNPAHYALRVLHVADAEATSAPLPLPPPSPSTGGNSSEPITDGLIGDPEVWVHEDKDLPRPSLPPASPDTALTRNQVIEEVRENVVDEVGLTRNQVIAEVREKDEVGLTRNQVIEEVRQIVVDEVGSGLGQR